MQPPYDGVDGAREVTPLAVTLFKRAMPCSRELIHAPPAAIDLRPAAGQESCVFQSVQRRIKGAFGKVEGAVAAGAKRFRNRISMSRFRLDRGEEEEVEVSL